MKPIIAICLIVVAIGAGYFFYNKKQSTKTPQTSSEVQDKSSEEMARTIRDY